MPSGEAGQRAEDALLEAVMAVASGLELGSTLERIVRVAVRAVDADFGALGVLGRDGRVREFVYEGMTAEQADGIGPLPEGRGILGLLRAHRESVRLNELSEHPAAAGFPPGHPPMGPFLGVPISVRDEVFGNLYLTRGQGAPEDFTAEDAKVVEQLAVAAGIAIDNARAFEYERARERYQTAVALIHEMLLSGIDVGEVLHAVAIRAGELAGADAALMILPNQHGSLAVEIVELMQDADERLSPWTVRLSCVPAADMSLVRGLIGHAVDDWATVASAVADGTSATVELTGSQAEVPSVVARLAGAYGQALVVPLRVPHAMRGAVVLLRRAGDEPFGPRSVALAEQFASQASLAVILSQTRADARRVAVMEERERIARDLHDLTIQRLFAAGIGLQSLSAELRKLAPQGDLSASLPAEPLADLAELADQAESTIDELYATISEIRSTIVGLQEHDSATSLRAAVIAEAQAAGANLQESPSVTFRGAVDSRVDSVVGDQLLAVLREALSNVVRHSGAQHVGVQVEVVDDVVELVVTDDGSGISDTAVPGAGLVNLTSRASELGGTAGVHSSAAGVTVVWRVPLA